MAPNYLNRTGFQDGTTMDLKYINPGFDKSEGMASGMGGFPIVPAAGIGAVLALNKKRGIGDNNPPSPIKEDKTPQQEPPEDKEPDIISELATGEILKESEDKIKNKITTWEDHFPTIEEATKAAKDVGGTLKEFEEGLIEKKITFKKLGNIGGQFFQVLYDGKEVAELSPLEEVVKEGIYKGLKEYNIKFIGDIDTADTVTGLAEAKASVKKYIADGLLDKSEPSPAPYYWQPLRKTFQEATFDKKGNYVEFPEEKKTEEVELVMTKKGFMPKKATGGLIDKPLTGRSRDI